MTTISAALMSWTRSSSWRVREEIFQVMMRVVSASRVVSTFIIHRSHMHTYTHQTRLSHTVIQSKCPPCALVLIIARIFQLLSLWLIRTVQIMEIPSIRRVFNGLYSIYIRATFPYEFLDVIQHTVQSIIILLTYNIWTKCSLPGC